MKWVIVGMFGLGLAAAVCAAVLVVSFQGGSEPAPDQPVQILVAGRDLDALTVIDAGSVVTREVGMSAAPAGALTDPVQAVGRMLLTSVGEGAPLTMDSFIADNSAARIAASLQPGFRAVNVQLNDPMAMENLLAPGSVVDVLASIQMEHDGRSEPVSVTLLQGVRVLALGGRLTSPPPSPTGEEATEDPATMRQRPTVTLLVDAMQAEKLKLAMQEGSVTLALRNPKDEEQVQTVGTALASLSPVFYRPASKPMTTSLSTSSDSRPPVPAVVPMPMPSLPPALQRQWETVILRGGVAETRSFSENVKAR